MTESSPLRVILVLAMISQKNFNRGSPRQSAYGVSVGHIPGYWIGSALRAEEKRTSLALLRDEKGTLRKTTEESQSFLKLTNLMTQYNNVGFQHDSPQKFLTPCPTWVWKP